MKDIPVNLDGLLSELTFSYSRSSGPGGQNVNKVSTKVEVRFNVAASSVLSENEKSLILEKLANRIASGGELIIVCQSERTQGGNKEKVVEKFLELIKKALTPRKKRKPTKPSLAAREKRLEEKRLISEKKEARRGEVELG